MEYRSDIDYIIENMLKLEGNTLFLEDVAAIEQSAMKIQNAFRRKAKAKEEVDKEPDSKIPF